MTTIRSYINPYGKEPTDTSSDSPTTSDGGIGNKIDEILVKFGYGIHYSENPGEQVMGPTVTQSEAKQSIISLVEESNQEAYKKGYIDGGIKTLNEEDSNHVKPE